MKKHLLLNQLFGTVGSPNQTGETLTRENRIGLMSYLRRTLMLLLVAYIGIGNVWGTDNANIANKNTENKQNINTNCNQAGTYIYTPDLSTQDTIYLKHQDTTPAGSWWQRNGWNLIQAALLLVLGALMSLFTGQVSASIERKRRKQELIEGKAIEIEKNIYKQFVALRNTQSDDERSKLLQQTESLLNEAELSMRTELYMASCNLLNFYTTYSQDDAESMAKEEALFAEYKKLYKKNNG